jgi:hypothetical protein
MKKLLIKAVMLLLSTGTLFGVQAAFAQMPVHPDDIIGGKVTAVTADQATIKTLANEPFTILFAPKTTFYKQIGTSFSMQPATAMDIKVGDSIHVMGHLDPDGTTKHAVNVMILTAETSQKILASTGGSGVTDVMGMVTAINGHRLTLEDYDKSSQVIEVNDQTKIFKGYGYPVVQQIKSPAGTTPPAGIETIEFPDIKLGDNLYAKGGPKFPPTVAPKDNIFLSTRIAVMSKGPEASTPGASTKP